MDHWEDFCGAQHSVDFEEAGVEILGVVVWGAMQTFFQESIELGLAIPTFFVDLFLVQPFYMQVGLLFILN